MRDSGSIHPLQFGLWAAAIAGFTVFNFPRARVFMGDVGSGVVGMLIAVAVIWQTSTPQVAAASGIAIVGSRDVDDAGRDRRSPVDHERLLELGDHDDGMLARGGTGSGEGDSSASRACPSGCAINQSHISMGSSATRIAPHQQKPCS